MRYPESPAVAADVIDQTAPAYRDAWRRFPGSGSYRGVSAIDGLERLGSYRQSEFFGFYVNMGLTLDSVLVTWHRHLKLMSTFWLLFVALSIYLARQLQLSWREQDRVMALHRESEQRLRLVAENTAEYICGVNPDRSISFVNRPLPGQAPDQGVGGDIFSLFPAAIQLVASSVLESCFLLQEGGEFEYEAAGSRGELRSYWAQVTPVVIAGEVATVVITITDITERKRFEQQVLNSRELLRQFLDHFPGVAYARDESLRVVMASRGFKALLGLEPREMIGRRNGELFPRELAEQMDADERQVLVDGKTRVIEEALGGRVYESTKFRIAQHESWLLAGITVDVTQRQRAAARVEILLRLSALGGTVSEQEFVNAGLQMAETLTGSTIGFLHFVNEDQETIELTAWTAGALENCAAPHDAHYPISQAGLWADSFRRPEAMMVNDYAACAEKRGLPEGHAPLQRLISVPVIEDGLVRMLMGVGNKPDNYDDFDLQSVQLIGNDLWRVVRRARVENTLTRQLAELTELNRKLAQAQNQLLQSEKMATIGQLAAGVAHELNNPIGFVQSNLGTLTGYVDDLLEIVDFAGKCVEKHGDAATQKNFRELAARKDLVFLREDVGQLLAESKDGADRVRRIVQNLKDFSHVSDDEWIWSDLHKGLDSTLNIVWNEIKYKAEVDKRYTALPEVFCVPSQLNQVFMNLLVNAAQAIEGKGKITIASGLLADQDVPAEGAGDYHRPSVWIEIGDTGKGIPAENLARIFDPFFTTKPVGQGTGLGLSLAWSIIQKHHGSLTVDSTVGVGTTFRITLPVDGRATPGVPSNE
jgi:PAS domain S-box-containing protein